MIACVLGLTACGSEKELTDFEQSKVDTAITVAKQYVIPSFENFRSEEAVAALSEYTAEEVAYVIAQSTGLTVDGYAYLSAVNSFNTTYETIGNLVSLGEATAKIDDDQIIVYVEVQGEQDAAEAEVILSNDMFLALESAALNPVQDMNDLMVGAALNTLIGMGTVFSVLILISLIISCFGLISKMQNAPAKKKEEPAAAAVKTNAVPAAAVAEAAAAEDDLELIAVIAAAVAASQGAASTDGFVVRSIRRRNVR